MPEVDPQFETSFQNMIDHEYSGKDRATKEYPNGVFGMDPGERPPTWTPQQLFAELSHEYKTMVDNRRAVWSVTFDQAVGLIQNTVNIYGALLGEVAKRDFSTPTPEWEAWKEANAKA
jgi:hypothetical protein